MKHAEEKRADANKRQAEYDKLTPAQKLQQLDSRLGKGVGAKRERQQYVDQIEYEANAKL